MIMCQICNEEIVVFDENQEKITICNCGRLIEQKNGDSEEIFTINIKIGNNDDYFYLPVKVINKIEYIKNKRITNKKESSILTIGDWELHSYDFRIPRDCTDLNVIEKQHNVI